MKFGYIWPGPKDFDEMLKSSYYESPVSQVNQLPFVSTNFHVLIKTILIINL